LPIWKPYGDPGANHIIYQMDPIWQNHMGGIWVSYDFAIGVVIKLDVREILMVDHEC